MPDNFKEFRITPVNNDDIGEIKQIVFSCLLEIGFKVTKPKEVNDRVNQAFELNLKLSISNFP